MDNMNGLPATTPQGQLLTGAYWLDAPVHAGDECKWCMLLVPDRAASDQRVGLPGE
ncbi:hypothetical protein AB0Q95_11360 [Streptomyces sp. NPDC059900]|uniref:hypothetical protein n=1 Tax=Streptomyces sp. NPDC059900 TaxID=3155816 RepID=UPI00342D568A